MTEAPCDFCTAPAQRPTWAYPAKPLLAEWLQLPGGSVWRACPVCYELIEAQDWETLEERIIAIMVARRPDLAKTTTMRVGLRGILEVFRFGREGPAVPYPPASNGGA